MFLYWPISFPSCRHNPFLFKSPTLSLSLSLIHSVNQSAVYYFIPIHLCQLTQPILFPLLSIQQPIKWVLHSRFFSWLFSFQSVNCRNTILCFYCTISTSLFLLIWVFFTPFQKFLNFFLFFFPFSITLWCWPKMFSKFVQCAFFGKTGHLGIRATLTKTDYSLVASIKLFIENL